MNQELGVFQLLKSGFLLHVKAWKITIVFLGLYLLLDILALVPTLGIEDKVTEFPGLAIVLAFSIGLVACLSAIWIYNILIRVFTGQGVTFGNANKNVVHAIVAYLAFIVLIFAILYTFFAITSRFMPMTESQVANQVSEAVEQTAESQMVSFTANQTASLILLPFLLYFGTRLVFYPLVVVHERLGLIKGIKRSFQLTKHRFFKTFFTIFLAGFFVGLISSLIGMFAQPPLTKLIMDALFFAFIPAVIVVYYMDLSKDVQQEVVVGQIDIEVEVREEGTSQS